MLLSTTRRYSGRIINVDQDQVQFPDGSIGTLEMVRHPGAAAVVPFLDRPTDPDPRILLIRQFRHAADDFIWEVPAGTLGAGEAPERCAHRELEEETGYRSGTMHHLITVFTTPGFTNERIHLFLASDLEFTRAHTEADEFITVHPFRWSVVGQMIRSGELQDAKSLTALMYVNCFRR